MSAHEVRKFPRRLGGAVLGGAAGAELVHRDHAVRPIEQPRPHRARNADEVGDDARRESACELRDEIGRASSCESLDQLIASAAMAGASRSTWRETKARLTSAAQTRVLGRLELEQRMTLDRLERRSGGRSPSARGSVTCAICRPKRRSRSSAETSACAREAPEAIVLPEESTGSRRGSRRRRDRGSGQKSGSRGLRRTRRRALSMTRSMRSTQRIGGFHHVGAAARAVARRIKRKAFGGETFGNGARREPRNNPRSRAGKRRATARASRAGYICGSRARARCAASAAHARPATP